MKGIWKWLVVHKKAFRPLRYMGYVAWCVLVVLCYVGKAEADMLPYGDVPTITEWELTGVETNGIDYLVAGTNATLKITLSGCHLNWIQQDWKVVEDWELEEEEDEDWDDEDWDDWVADWEEEVVSIKHEFTQVLLVATGVTKPDGKVIYGFGRTDPNATYGDNDIFNNDGADVVHVLGDIDLSEYQKVLVSNDLPAWSVSDLSSTSVVITLSIPLLPGADMHGKFKFTPVVNYNEFLRFNIEEDVFEEVTSLGALFANSSSTNVVERPIFFDKYGQDFPEEGPNWFVYWREDGAVPALKGGVTYRPVRGAPDICQIGELEELLKDVPGVDRNAWGGTAFGAIEVYDKAAKTHYYHEPSLNSLVAGGIDFRKKWVYGIYTVANVLAHEQEHIELLRLYSQDLNKEKGIHYPPKTDQHYKSLQAVNSDYDCVLDDDPNGGIHWRPGLDGWMCSTKTIVTKEDYMTNAREQEINKKLKRLYGIELSINNVDTFDLAAKKDKTYSQYGDNEFMAMLAGLCANEDDTTAIEEHDWAYPGHQSCLPDIVTRRPKNTSSMVSNSVLSMEDFHPMQVATTQMVTSETPFTASNGVAVALNREGVARGEEDVVRYELSFDVSGSKMMHFVGYLSNPASNVVACAGVTTELTADNHSCVLSFPVKEIFASGFEGPYTLMGVVVYRVGDWGDLVCEGIYRGVMADWVKTAEPTPTAKFTTGNVSCSKGSSFDVVVSGGSTEHASSVQIFLSYQTAAAADLDLAKGMIDSVVPKGGLKFPLTLNWAAGEVTNRVITIPVKVSEARGKTLTFQLMTAQGQDIGETSVCTVTIVNEENEGFPEVKSDADVGNALSGTESALRENITTKEEYDAFRSWAQSVKRADGSTAGVQTVKESTRAWLSFALGMDTLIGKDITSDDVRIVSFQMEGGNDEAISSSSRSPTFIFEVAIDCVKIGSGVVAEETLKSNLKKVLEVEGSTQLDATSFSSDNIEIVFESPVDGRARFMATIPSGLDNTFFMRVKVK